jgi:hypothetical protein
MAAAAYNILNTNSLMKIKNADAKSLGVKGNPLFMVTHYEYVTANNKGDSEYGKLIGRRYINAEGQEGSA